MEGSGEFRFDVLGKSEEHQTTDPRSESGTETYFAPRDLDGYKITYGDGSSVIEFGSTQAYDMDDESGKNRELAGDYDAETNGDTVVVTFTVEMVLMIYTPSISPQKQPETEC